MHACNLTTWDVWTLNHESWQITPSLTQHSALSLVDDVVSWMCDARSMLSNAFKEQAMHHQCANASSESHFSKYVKWNQVISVNGKQSEIEAAVRRQWWHSCISWTVSHQHATLSDQTRNGSAGPRNAKNNPYWMTLFKDLTWSAAPRQELCLLHVITHNVASSYKSVRLTGALCSGLYCRFEGLGRSLWIQPPARRRAPSMSRYWLVPCTLRPRCVRSPEGCASDEPAYIYACTAYIYAVHIHRI